MADIFISYAHEDRDSVERLAASFEEVGFSVWWDRQLEAGAEFSKDIEEELNRANAVVVIWSEHSLSSTWVRDEATLAIEKGTFIPVRFDGTEPPIGFRQFQVFDLSSWKGKSDVATLQALMGTLQRKIGSKAEPVSASAAASLPSKLKDRPGLILAAAAASLVVVVALMFQLLMTGTAPSPESGDGADFNAEAADTQLISLGVIPFVNMSSDPEQEHFADGLSEELLNWLANVDGLKVPGRTSSFYYKDRLDDLRLIGERLDVRYLLEGSVRRSGNALRITAQLIEAETGYHLWLDTYDREMVDLFAIQEEIARRVIMELLGALPNQGIINPAEAGDVDADAHGLYLEGRGHWAGRNTQLAVKKFREAIAVDPNHYLAHAYLAIAIAHSVYNQYSLSLDNNDPNILMEEALAKAVSLRPKAADTLFAQGWVHEMTTENQFRQREGSGTGGMQIGFYKEAIKTYPRHAEALYALARNGESCTTELPILRQVLEIDPAMRSARSTMIKCLAEAGDFAAARQLINETYILLDRSEPNTGGNQAKTIGDIEFAADILFRNISLYQDHGLTARQRATVLTCLGADKEAAAVLDRYLASAREDPRLQWTQFLRTQFGKHPQDPMTYLTALMESKDVENWVPIILSTYLYEAGREEEVLDILPGSRKDLAAGALRIQIGQFSSFGDRVAYTYAMALDASGRPDEARTIWQMALAAEGNRSDQTWQKPLNLAVIHAQLGKEDEAISYLKTAYDKGFRFIRNYNCITCIDRSLFDEKGYLDPIRLHPDVIEIRNKIMADNAKSLARVDAKYGFLEEIRGWDKTPSGE